MKVAWLAPYPLPLIGPRLRLTRTPGSYHPCSWIVNHAKALAKVRGIELHVVTHSPAVSGNQIVMNGGLCFHIIKSGVPFLNRGFPGYFPFDVMTGYFVDSLRLVREIKRINPDIVHAHGTEGPYALSGIKSGYKCVISIQGIVNELFKLDPKLSFRIRRRYENWAVKNGRFFFCRTEFDTGFVRGRNSMAMIFQNPEAMDLVFFNTSWAVSNRPMTLFVGAMERKKGVETLLHAVQLCKKEIPKITLVMVGEGRAGYLAYLEELCQRLGIRENVRFAGFKGPGEIAEYHAKAQVFVYPSYIDNSPNALAEAMVSGMPVIASRVGGIPSMIEDGKTGILIEPDNPSELAEKIIYLLSNTAERKRLGANTRKVARDRHLSELVAEKTIQAYRDILDLEREHK